MCGIVGFKGTPDKELLRRMKSSVSHRGPDDQCSYLDKEISLGMQRLAIIDLTKGIYPMHNETKDVWLVFNGEIYNFMQLRQELEKKGHRFYTDCDAEVIVHGYEEWGLDVVKRLGGMFAIALWDARKKLLVLARDRIGVKPLYYTQAGGKFLFASEIKALLQADFVKRMVNKEALYHYFTFVNTPAPSTLFADIFKVEPGQVVTIDKQGKVAKRKYWDLLETKIDYSLTEQEVLKTTEELLVDSMRQRMISDVPQGVFLSGGVDSSTLVALMSEFQKEPVNTFSIAFEGEADGRYNELRYAKMVAGKFATNHHEIVIDYDKVLDFLPKMVHHQDEPVSDPVNAPVYYLSEYAKKKGVSVLQAGEGSDELFCGYNVYRLELQLGKLLRPIKKSPSFVSTAAIGSTKLLQALGMKRFHMIEDQLVDMRKNAITSRRGVLGYTELEKKELLAEPFRKETNGLNSYDYFRSIEKKIHARNAQDEYLQKARIVEMKNRLPELLLMRLDKFTMAASVEAREPFLDYKLVEYAFRTPPSTIHMKNGQYKHVLKTIMAKRLPKEIIQRKKVGFGIPLSRGIETVMKGYVEDALRNKALVPYIDQNYATRMLERHRAGRMKDSGMKLWTLLNFALWHKYWIEGERIK